MNHGLNYTADPISVDICYPGTVAADSCLFQNGSFSQVFLLARGVNYIDGDLCLVSQNPQYNDKSNPWKASFKVFRNGSIQNVSLDFQGIGYETDPSFVDLCYKVRAPEKLLLPFIMLVHFTRNESLYAIA
jgi:hypothetical protein